MAGDHAYLDDNSSSSEDDFSEDYETSFEDDEDESQDDVEDEESIEVWLDAILRTVKAERLQMEKVEDASI